MIKDVIEINKKEENADFITSIKQILSRVNDRKLGLASIMIFVEYTETPDNKILYLLNGKKENYKNLDKALLKFRTELVLLVQQYIETNVVSAKLIVGYNYTESDYIRYKNLSNQKNDESSCIFVPKEPMYSFERMILSDKVLNELNKTVLLIQNQEKIHKEWGFSEIEPNPKCVINFYGPPGTGKTMAAHSIANSVGKKILILNYSDIESKYVGEAPKNLIKAFQVATETDSILFFDEADSFLGTRIRNVQQSADQAINSLRSQMLMALEMFNVIVIFSTNLLENYDKAFESRIIKNIEFELPNEQLRKELIKMMIPTKVPKEEELFDSDFLNELSKLINGFSAREIKNLALEVLVTTIEEDEQFVSKNIIRKVFEKAQIEQQKENSQKSPQKVKLTPENFEKKIRDGVESGNYVAYKASDL